MKKLVISAVNIVEGGTLKVLQDFVRAARKAVPDWDIVAIVNNKDVIDVEGINIICIPESKKSYIRRIYIEYIYFRRLSKKLKADIWVSMHDLSPIVHAGSQFTYCHNSNQFYNFSWTQIYNEPKLLLFSKFYSLFYNFNINANRAVIVQQEWIRAEFKRRYPVSEVIVAHPVDTDKAEEFINHDPISTFVYPSLPRGFKNFELIGEAVKILEKRDDWSGRVIWTIDSEENKLSKSLYRSYGACKSINFIGRQNRYQMNHLYSQMDCLLFPSFLETWGLPISETKSLGKPMIVADLPYAHETVGTYDHVLFVDPADPMSLADMMLAANRTGWKSSAVKAPAIDEPFAKNWDELLSIILNLHQAKASV